jgi:mannosyltransferase OCH1-like enzyme
MIDNMIDIHFLWINNQPLSNLEKMCLNSHINNNHSCVLWSYDTSIQYPNGIEIRDANRIIPKDKIFSYKKPPFKNNLAGFSDLFRYKVLYEYGGWWCDTDVLCLKRFDFSQDYVFGAERRMNKTIGLAPAVIKCPIKSNLIKSCLEDAEKRLSINTNINWCELAHPILNTNINKYNLQNYIVNYNIFCPIDWFDAKKFFIPNTDISLDKSYGIHLWNTVIHREKINTNKVLANSLYSKYLNINIITPEIFNNSYGSI